MAPSPHRGTHLLMSLCGDRMLSKLQAYPPKGISIDTVALADDSPLT